jgi:hypothetical protein
MLMGRRPPTAHGPSMVRHRRVMGHRRTLMGRRPAMAHLPATVDHRLVMSPRRTLIGRHPAIAYLPSTVRQLSTVGHRAPTSQRRTQFRACRRARTPGA